jgi:hypothetical protein
MCDRHKVEPGDPGAMWTLCADFTTCLVAELAQQLGQPLRNIAHPLTEVLTAFGRPAVAILEYDYFDLDYRSEFSAVHETSFAARDPDTLRLHFLGVEAQTTMRSTVDLAAASADKGQRGSYLGYVVLRPQSPGTVGRSIITPRGSLPQADGDATLLDGEALESHVRTAVTEFVELFGVQINAVGVPFMEQDGHLLRCVHVSAWICHFTAVLRGLVPRKESAAFHHAEDPTGAYGRQYPSAGLSEFSLTLLLRKLDLPPEVAGSDRLSQAREPSWYDGEDVRRAANLEPGGKRAQTFWLTKNLVGHVCRAVNSGFPCILTRDDYQTVDGHTQVVCGYLRAEDVNATDYRRAFVGPDERFSEADAAIQLTPDAALDSDVVALLVHDDQDGPYRFVWIGDLVQAIEQDTVSVLTPMPRGLWLPGDLAERASAQIFAEAVRQRRRRTRRWPQLGTQADTHAARLSDIVKWTTKREPSRLALRTYAILGTDFKIGFAQRTGDPAAARAVGYAALPKFVWVTEIIDRDLRSHPDRPPMVLGTVVLDATTVMDDRPATLERFSPLVIHIPGQISLGNPAAYKNENWIPTSLAPYPSGRWHHNRKWLHAPERIAGRSKAALSGR